MPKTNMTPEQLEIRKRQVKKECQARYKASHREHTNAYNASHPRKKSKYDKENRRARWLQISYGITLLEYKNLHEAQDGRCAICGSHSTKETILTVDHDHITGKVRGLLCSQCNAALGLFHDSISALTASIEYLKSYQ